MCFNASGSVGLIAQAKNRQCVGRCCAIPFLRKKEPLRNNSVLDENRARYIMIAGQQSCCEQELWEKKIHGQALLTTFTVLMLFSVTFDSCCVLTLGCNNSHRNVLLVTPEKGCL